MSRKTSATVSTERVGSRTARRRVTGEAAGKRKLTRTRRSTASIRFSKLASRKK